MKQIKKITFYSLVLMIISAGMFCSNLEEKANDAAAATTTTTTTTTVDPADAAKTTADSTSLTFTSFTFGISQSETGRWGNFTVPTNGAQGSTITWAVTSTCDITAGCPATFAGGTATFSQTATDAVAGVNCPGGICSGPTNTTVTITATIKSGSSTVTKSFDLVFVTSAGA